MLRKQRVRSCQERQPNAGQREEKKSVKHNAYHVSRENGLAMCEYGQQEKAKKQNQGVSLL